MWVYVVLGLIVNGQVKQDALLKWTGIQVDYFLSVVSDRQPYHKLTLLFDGKLPDFIL